MSTDKFGRHRLHKNKSFDRIHSGRQRSFGPLTLTSEGDVNANGKRIRFVGDPIDEQDCSTKKHTVKFIEQRVNNVVNQLSEYIGTQFRREAKKYENLNKLFNDGKAEIRAIASLHKLTDEKISMKFREDTKKFENLTELLNDVEIKMKAIQTSQKRVDENITNKLQEVAKKFQNIDKLLEDWDTRLEAIDALQKRADSRTKLLARKLDAAESLLVKIKD